MTATTGHPFLGFCLLMVSTLGAVQGFRPVTIARFAR